MLTVALKNTKATSLKVINLFGEVILTKELNNNPEATIQFDLSSIPQGLYLISCGASILKFSKQ